MTRVLVTRPAGQEQALIDALTQRGHEAVHCPALAIEPLTLSAEDRTCLAQLDRQDRVIAVSANAVKMLAEKVDLSAASVTSWLAVGQATAQALAAHGLPVQAPQTGANTEALLAMPGLQQVAGQKVLILAGEGGRELLGEALKERGAQVHSVALYRRTCDAQFSWPEQPVDIVMVTSLAGWQCIAGKVPANVSVLAGSERIAESIRATHKGVVVTAESPMDSAMLAALEKVS